MLTLHWIALNYWDHLTLVGPALVMSVVVTAIVLLFFWNEIYSTLQTTTESISQTLNSLKHIVKKLLKWLVVWWKPVIRRLLLRRAQIYGEIRNANLRVFGPHLKLHVITCDISVLVLASLAIITLGHTSVFGIGWNTHPRVFIHCLREPEHTIQWNKIKETTITLCNLFVFAPL